MVELYESPLRAAVAHHARGVIEANDQIRQNYGGVLGHLQPMVAGYDRVFVISEREIEAFLDYQERTPEDDWTLVGLLDHMYPGREAGKFVAHMPQVNEEEPEEKSPAARLIEVMMGRRPLGSENAGSSKEDYQLMAGLLQRTVRDDGSIRIPPAATSLVAGDPANPFQIGFLMLPERMTLTPENIMSSVPKEFHRLQNLDPTQQEQRRRDTAAAVVAHEVGHLVQFIGEGRHAVQKSSVREQSASGRFGGELFADRQMLAWIPGMHQAGVISDPLIGQQMLDGRKIETFNRMATDYGRVTINPLGTGERTALRSGIYEHSVGFLAAGSVPHGAALGYFDRGTGALREEMNRQAQAMCREGIQGEGDPKFGAFHRRVDDSLAGIAEDVKFRNLSPQMELQVAISQLYGGMEYLRGMGCMISHTVYAQVDPAQSRLLHSLDPSKLGPEGRVILNEYQGAVGRMLVDNPGPTDERVQKLIDQLAAIPTATAASSPTAAPIK